MDLVFLDHLRCDGSEKKLVDCPSLYFLPQCSHEDNVAVRCNGTSSIKVSELVMYHLELKGTQRTMNYIQSAIMIILVPCFLNFSQ